MIRLACLAIGYVFGLFQTGYFYGKWKGMDIREHGSGNAGTTNALRTMGWKAGLVTLLGDAFKCVFAVLFVKALFGKAHADIRPLLGMYAALGVTLGHNFPFYLHFRGGKGIAAMGGLYLSTSWGMTLTALATFGIAVGLTRYVSLGSILISMEFPLGVILLGQMGRWGMTGAPLYEMYAVAVFIGVMAIFRHRANIRRLLNGTERKIGERAE